MRLLALGGLLVLAACGAGADDGRGPGGGSPGDPASAGTVDQRPNRLGCPDAVSATIDYFVDAAGDPGTPVEVVRRRASELGVPLEGGDVVEPAGGGAGQGALVRVVRDDAVVGLFELEPAADGGWLVTTVMRCEGP
jgi:hypothetical protein